ncbi:MAG: phosphate ABC transporter permease [Desulfobacterales bacterium PC51MH44]|nr:MAG: phosphate ABC transporter permease [Desulfobacterales bacterium PC51MH44]
MTRPEQFDTSVTVIEAKSGWQVVNFKELREYNDLFHSMVWREIKILYAQTILGFSWAIFQPLLQIVIFTVVFGKVAKIPTDGIPYVLFSTVAIIPWTYISQSVSLSSQSLIAGQGMLGKVYFPRLIFPFTPVLAKLVDFGISMLIIIGICAFYRVYPTWNLLLFPLLFVVMVSTAAGIGMWLSALSIRFRDVKHALPFAIRMLMYSAPIVYSASSIPEKYRIVYSLNPIVAITEGYRACFLGTPIEWQYLWPGIIIAVIILITGMLYFHRIERVFVDVI